MECCASEKLCDGCYGRELVAKRSQARVLGECWAERICRGELQALDWPDHGDKTLEIARRLVGALARDPRLREALAVACTRGAAAWWQRRPLRYRR